MFPKEEWSANTIIGLLKVYEGCVEGVDKLFSLVYEGICDEDVVSSPAAFSKCTLEGMGYVGVFHKLHKVSVEDAGKEFAKTTSDGYGAVVSWIMLEPFLWRVVI